MRRVLTVFGALVALVAGAVPAVAQPNPAQPNPAQPGLVRSSGVDAIEGRYVVVLEPGATTAAGTAQALVDRYGGAATAVWRRAVRGFALSADAATAARIAADPRVAYVQQDARVAIADTQSPTPSWGLDRIDQRALPLDSAYTFDTGAPIVTAYVLDTGIHTTHADFQGRAVFAVNTTGDGRDTDCHGHGTHVAGTIGGAAYGVAKQVRLVAVKVLDCFGFGSFTGVISGVEWVSANAQHPAVANMSLTGPAFPLLDDAVAGAIAGGVTFAVAAGNDSAEACDYSPARTPAAITVNASDPVDSQAWFSNHGSCTDLFAPGVTITSAWHTGDTATNTLDGTSMAAPHVAGAAALQLAANPFATPADVTAALLSSATPNVITNLSPATPNLLLFTSPTRLPPPSRPLSRYRNGFDQASATSAPAVGYQFDAALGSISPIQIPGTHPIYQCRVGISDLFSSQSIACERQALIARIGYLYSSPPSPRNFPIFRCALLGNGQRFDSTDPNCEGERVAGVLGYSI